MSVDRDWIVTNDIFTVGNKKKLEVSCVFQLTVIIVKNEIIFERDYFPNYCIGTELKVK